MELWINHKIFSIFFVFIAGMVINGCLVRSLHPFYQLSDRIYDEAMIGNWIDEDSCIWIIRPHVTPEGLMSNKPVRMDSTYQIIYFDESDAGCYMQGTLFVLNGQRYVDFVPDPQEQHCTADMTFFHHVPVHTLARMHSSEGGLMFFWFGEEWLNELLENKRIRIDHEKVQLSAEYEGYLLTADTEELQKFIIKYMNDEDMNAEIEKSFATGKEAEDHVLLKLIPYEGPLPKIN